MSGNYNQYDPTDLFKTWIQKNGRAQAEFIRNFGALMSSQSGSTFDPLETLKEVSERTSDAQSKMIEDVSAMQNKSMNAMFSMGQMATSFVGWGTYKTAIGSNGRISIPEAERSALGLEEGDLVQVVVIPIAKSKQNKEVKQ